MSRQEELKRFETENIFILILSILCISLKIQTNYNSVVQDTLKILN